jgi:hypothetical protein
MKSRSHATAHSIPRRLPSPGSGAWPGTIWLALVLSLPALSGCKKTSTGKGAEIPGSNEECFVYTTKDREFKYVTQQARVETHWYEEWTSRYGETLPEALPAPVHWQHPRLGRKYASTMHEDSLATDVSVNPGPIPSHANVEYFHVLEKGTKLSGMSPFYTFLDDDTMLTISFGRDAATLLVVDISDEAKILDSVSIPGRGSKVFDLIGKGGRLKVFRDTSGGAYSYVDAKGDVYVPGADNTIIRIPVRDRKIVREKMVLIDLNREVSKGDWIDDAMDRPDNVLTAIMPDSKGRVWFTTKYGVIGVVDLEFKGVCPEVYTTAVIYHGFSDKVRRYFDELPEGAEEFMQRQEKVAQSGGVDELAELRREGVKIFQVKDEPFEQIQNSFSVGPDGIYMVTNVALYKFRFNDEEKRIELDPKWAPNYAKGDLVYDNDRQIKPGHLNNGSGTTPTLVDDRFVAIVDNAPEQVNLLVFRQEDGTLVSKLPLFEPGAGAVENSVVAYDDSLLVGNTYGFTDPFKENPTPGGIMRFDYDEAKGEYDRVEGWPATGHFDAKTATPKLSTANGLFYAYTRDMTQEDHRDWQLTAVDFRTGWRVFSIKGTFDKKEFDDNVSGLVKRVTLGKPYYDRKVFNNIWGTFSFGPKNSIFIGTYRGYVRFSSAAELSDASEAKSVSATEPAEAASMEPESIPQ